VVAESVLAVFEEREKVGGLRMVYEPRYLRFFQARFEPLQVSRATPGAPAASTMD
jgi:tyrosine phenol-lyase